MARINGTVKAKKVLASASLGGLRTLPEPNPDNRPHPFERPAMVKQPSKNQRAGKTQTHFAAALLHVRHIKKPRKAAHTMLRMISFHTMAETV
jgi:hypothetical protein